METKVLQLNILMTPHGDAFAAASEVVGVCKMQAHSRRMDGPVKHCKSLDLNPFFLSGRYTSCGGRTAKTSTRDAYSGLASFRAKPEQWTSTATGSLSEEYLKLHEKKERFTTRGMEQ